MKQVESIEELENELKKALKLFMEENKQFNIQGEFKGENGRTVNALIDFGIEDLEHGEYSVANVSSQFEENLEYLDEKGLISEEKPVDEVEPEKLIEEFGESEIFIEVENAIMNAIKQVYKVGSYEIRGGRPQISDIDVSSTIPIDYGNWETRKEVDDYRRPS